MWAPNGARPDDRVTAPAPSGSRPRGLILLLVHAVCVQLVSYGLRPAISFEILQLGLDAAWLGIAATAFALPPLLLALPSGRIVDRLGERGMLVTGGLTLAAAAVVTVSFSSHVIGLIIATALLGLGVLFSVVGEQSWVMRGAVDGRLDSTFGVYTFATSAGQMLGPVLLLLPGSVGTPSLRLVAISTLCMAVIAVALSIGIRSVAVAPRAKGRRATDDGILSLLRRPGVPSALIASSIVLTSLDLVMAYLPLLADERGIATVWVSAFLVARGAATMASRLCLGRLTRRFGRRLVLIVGGAVAAASLSVLAFPVVPIALVAAGTVYGLAAGTAQPLTMSWMTLVTARERRGTAASLRLIGNRVGQTVIPLAAAGVSTVIGAAGVFAVTGAALVISATMSRAAPNGSSK